MIFFHLFLLDNYDFILINKVIIQNVILGGRRKSDFKSVKI